MADRSRTVGTRPPGITALQRIGSLPLVLLCWLLFVQPAFGRSLERALISTFPGALQADGAGLARVFRSTVSSSFPVTSTSASYVYRFDPSTDSFERQKVPLGPVFSERARTVGSGRVSLGVNYALLLYDEIDGRNLSGLVSNDPGSGKDFIITSDGEPVRSTVDLDLEAQVVTFTATYGVTEDLDVNLLLPLVRSFLRARTTFAIPDPRLPSTEDFEELTFRASEAATGAGDLLVRLKYLPTRNGFVDLAGGLTVSLPTGDADDFHGTGDTLVGVALYASRIYADRVEPHVNLGFLLNADKFDRSQVRYSAGADFRLLDWLTVNGDFLGRSDVARPDEIDRPVFVQIERSDILQFSTGLKMAPPWQQTFHTPGIPGLPWLWFFNALLPLNDDGLRADPTLSFGFEVVM